MNLNQIAVISESSASNSVVIPFRFDENLSISETFSAAVSIISEASSELSINYSIGADVLIESAVNRETKVDTLSEAIATNFVTGVKNFFKKIKEVVLGVGERIKRQFELNTKSKSEFVSKVKKELEKKGTKDKEKFQYTGYAWNSSFLSGPGLELEKLSGSLHKEMQDAVNAIKDIKTLDAVISVYTDVDKDDITVERAKEHLAEALGVNFENVLADLTKQARKESKDDIKGFEKVSSDAMLTFIDKCDDMISKQINKVLDTAKTNLDKLISACEGAEKIEFKTEGLPEEKRDGARDAISNFKKTLSVVKDSVQFSVNFSQKYAGAVESLANEASKEFMRVLRAYALTASAK